MLLELVLCLVSLFILFIWWYQNYSHFFLLLNKVPGPEGYPILGNVLRLCSTEKMFQTDREFYHKYYPIYREYCLWLGFINLMDPDDIEVILSSSKHIDKGVEYNFLHAWLKSGLLTSGGTKWQNRRKILTPSFHFNILQEFVPMFNKKTAKMVEEIRSYQNSTIDVLEPVTKFTLFAIAQTSMGVDLEAVPKKEWEQYQKAIYDFGYSVAYRLGRPWLLFDGIFYNFTQFGREIRRTIKTLHSFSRNVIEEKKRIFLQPKKKRMAMLELLLWAKHQGAEISDEGIAEEVDTFMFEGHDTTTLSISYTLLLLANHSLIQEQVFEEMKSVLKDPSKPPTYEDLKELNLMERCIKESLRLFPSVPFISRVLSENITTVSGYELPKNTVVHVHIYDLHRDPQIYPDPEKFDPSRFESEQTKNRHPFVYIPFSAGPRNCIGQKFAMLELKTVLCGILSNFILEAVDTCDSLVLVTDLVLRNKSGVKVKFIPRY